MFPWQASPSVLPLSETHQTKKKKHQKHSLPRKCGLMILVRNQNKIKCNQVKLTSTVVGSAKDGVAKISLWKSSVFLLIDEASSPLRSSFTIVTFKSYKGKWLANPNLIISKCLIYTMFPAQIENGQQIPYFILMFMTLSCNTIF